MTALQRGMFQVVGFAQETTFGTYKAPVNFLRAVSVTPNNKIVSAVDPVLFEGMDETLYYMQNEAAYDVVLRNNYEGEELLWHGLLGTYDYAVGTGSEYDHTFSYDPDGTHDFLTGLSFGASFANDVSGGNLAFRALTGAHITAATIEGNANDFLRTTFTLLGQKLSLQDAITASFPSALPVLGSRSTTFVLGNAALKCSDWRINITVPRAEGRFHYGDQDVAEAVRVGRLTATLEATVELDTTANAGWSLLTELQSVHAASGAPSRKTLNIVHATVGNVDATAPYSFTIDGDFMIQGDEPSVQDSGIITYNLRGQLVTDGTTDLEIAIHNGTLGKVTT